MRQELNDIEKIEKYLEGKLEKQQQAAFEQEIKTNKSLQEKVNFQASFVQQLKEMAFLEDVQNYHQEYLDGRAAISKTGSRRNWIVLGLLLVLMSLLWVFWWWSRASAEGEGQWLQGEADIPQIEQPIRLVAIEPARFREKFVIERIKNNKGARVRLRQSGSVLRIPAEAVRHENGAAIVGEYEIHYREYRNAAQMAFAKIPMYRDNQRFHSAGMLEIRAYQDGKVLQIAPEIPIRLDYELTERLEELELYQLEDSSQAWQSRGPVDLPLSMEEYQVIERQKAKERTKKEVKAADARWVEELVAEKVAVTKLRGRKEYPIDDTSVIHYDDRVDVGVVKLMPLDTVAVEENVIEQPMKLMPVPTPKKHIVKHKHHPKLVKNLVLPAFGCYNIAQERTLENKIVIYPKYTDIKSYPIENGATLSVIDLEHNAAYSFEPDNFICDKESANVFLLWTNDGKLYAFFKNSQQKISDKPSIKISLTMDNIGTEVTNSSDLVIYLKQLRNRDKAMQEEKNNNSL